MTELLPGKDGLYEGLLLPGRVFTLQGIVSNDDKLYLQIDDQLVDVERLLDKHICIFEHQVVKGVRDGFECLNESQFEQVPDKSQYLNYILFPYIGLTLEITQNNVTAEGYTFIVAATEQDLMSFEDLSDY